MGALLTLMNSETAQLKTPNEPSIARIVASVIPSIGARTIAGALESSIVRLIRNQVADAACNALCHLLHALPSVPYLPYRIGSFLATETYMNRLLWIFGAILTTQASIATMMSEVPSDNSAAVSAATETIVGFSVESLTEATMAPEYGFAFHFTKADPTLSRIWILAQKSNQLNLVMEIRKGLGKTELRNSYDIKNVAGVSLLCSRDTLPTLGECSAQWQPAIPLNESVSNFGISQYATNSTIR
jgi:hypothetical protein